MCASVSVFNNVWVFVHRALCPLHLCVFARHRLTLCINDKTERGRKKRKEMTALTLSSDILKSPASRGQRKFCKNRPTRRADSQTVGEMRPESIQRGRQREARAQREGRSIQRTRPNSIQRVSGDRKGLCSFIDLSR